LTVRSVDLSAPLFWAFVAVGVVALRTVTVPQVRRVIWVAINVSFVAALVGFQSTAAIVVYVVGVHCAAKEADRLNRYPTMRVLVLGAAGLLTLVLFLLRKLAPPDFQHSLLSTTGLILAAVGFSYIALRASELLRAGAEHRLYTADWLDSMNYLLPFHMLAAGPIQPWDEFAKQPTLPADLDIGNAVYGIDRIVGGLFKKFVLARAIELAILTGFRAPWPYVLVEAQFYYLWVYLDFSAYSDIAVGTGRLMGIETPENFNKPLLAQNIIVFWERWHITLSHFVRRNIFIPIQLNLMRRSEVLRPALAASVAVGAAFIGVGLWHGVAWRYVIWGILHAMAVLCCIVYRTLLTKRFGRKRIAAYTSHSAYRVLATIITFEFVAFSLVFLVHPATAFLE
jgi:D-alanyl-lipoteichoic acid acyltransferase DltB (MBOAT superfamily)